MDNFYKKITNTEYNSYFRAEEDPHIVINMTNREIDTISNIFVGSNRVVESRLYEDGKTKYLRLRDNHIEACVDKIRDDWYLVMIDGVGMAKGYRKEREFYKCDQLDGLVALVRCLI